MHGDDDQVVPIDVSGRKSVKLIPGAKLIEYAGAPHGITDTHKDRLNADLLAFLQVVKPHGRATPARTLPVPNLPMPAETRATHHRPRSRTVDDPAQLGAFSSASTNPTATGCTRHAWPGIGRRGGGGPP